MQKSNFGEGNKVTYLHLWEGRNLGILSFYCLLNPILLMQVLDGKPYNHKCDVYSFGICLWEIYCCDMPYPDLSFAEVSSAVVRHVC